MLAMTTIQARYLLLFLACCFALASCVTTTGKNTKIDKKKALEANIKLGMAYLQRDLRDSALRSFLKALDIDKRSAEAHQGLAIVQQLNGEIDAAEASFKTALRSRIDFSRAPIEFSYGRFLYELKRYDEALSYFDAAASDLGYKDRPSARYYAGLCALAQGDKARARGAFEHALNLDKKLAPAALELAGMAFEQRNYALAKENLDLFAANSSHTPRSLWLGIRIERIFDNVDKEASYALALKNMHPYSKEYLEYKRLLESSR